MTEKALSPPMEAFALAIAEGTMSQSDAYRKAYPVAKAWKPDSVHNKASALMRDARVLARVQELKKPAVQQAQLTLSAHLAALLELREAAIKQGKFSAAVAAEIARGRAAGHYIIKVEDVTDPLKKAMANMTPERAEEMLAALDQVEKIGEKAKRATKQ